MTPVKSSNIAAAEYVDGRIRVQYRDGTIYAQPATVELFGEFMAAESKGTFARVRLNLLTRDGYADVQLREPAVPEGMRGMRQGYPSMPKVWPPNPNPPESAAARITDMMDEDECCAARLGKALAGGHNGDTWTCPKCGCEWRGNMIPEASIRHWSPQSDIEVIRLR